jgi:hypothetical protein
VAWGGTPTTTAICEEGQGHGEAHGAGGGAELEETERVTQVWVAWGCAAGMEHRLDMEIHVIG